MPVILGGNTGIYLASLTPSVDRDAQAFITAAAITDPTQQAAINTLVVDLKGYSIWSKMKALYPMVGGTSTSTSFNLKNTAQYQLTWIGGVTWNANGVTFGVNGYANTNFLDSNFTTSSGAMGGYSRTNNNVSAYDMGVYSTTLAKGSYMGFSRNAATYGVVFQQLGSSGESEAPNTNGTGFYSGGKNAVNSVNGYRNGIPLISAAKADVSAVGQNIYIGTLNINNLPGAGYSQRNWAFAFMSDGLNATENANLYTAVQAFQTTLGRSIGTQTVSDADAQAFVIAADIQDQVEANAINNLVIGMKADGTWTKMKAVYPFVGGTNTSNSYNLKNTAQYQISWAGGVTSSANGVTFGVNGYGNTGLNPTTALSLNDTHLSFYSRTDGAGGIDIGATAATDTRNLFIAQAYFGNFYADSYSSTSRFTLASQVKGLLTISRTAINSFKAFRNAAQIGSTITTSAGTLPNWNIFLGATNLNGVTNPSVYSARNQAFASIGDGLTDTDAANLYTRVQNFNTALARQV